MKMVSPDNMFRSEKEKSIFYKGQQVLMSGLLKQAIEDGIIDPKDKTADEIKNEFIKHLSPIGSRKVEFRFVLDHTESLLSEARNCLRQKKYYFSCLFYATWVEHWFNKMITSYSVRKGFTHNHIKSILRDVSLHGKVTWLLRMIDLPSINSNHTKIILDLAELRNGYVHYKWSDKDFARRNEDDKKIELRISSFENTVNYLKRYERKYLFADKKLITKKIIKKTIKNSV